MHIGVKRLNSDHIKFIEVPITLLFPIDATKKKLKTKNLGGFNKNTDILIISGYDM